MNTKRIVAVTSLVLGSIMLSATAVHAGPDGRTGACSQLPGHSALKAALTSARQAVNGGFDLDMWGTIVNRDGIVCAVAFTGVKS